MKHDLFRDVRDLEVGDFGREPLFCLAQVTDLISAEEKNNK